MEENVATMSGRLPKPLLQGKRRAAVGRAQRAAALVLLAALGAVRLASGTSTATATTTPTATATATTNAGPQNPAVTSQPTAVPSSYSRPQPIKTAALALAVRRVVIDAGHGGTNLGTSAGSGLREKDVTLDIAERLRARLAGDGLTVLMTRTADATISLQERSDKANGDRGDIFVSIHVNSLAPKSRGVETYYLGPSGAPAADALAAHENRDSGYSLADLRSLLDRIYFDARKDESKRLAESVQHALFRDLRRVNGALEDRGVKTAPFVVLVGTEMPAILAEVSCLSNTEEAALLGGQSYRQTIADALFDGIQTYLREGASGGDKEKASGR